MVAGSRSRLRLSVGLGGRYEPKSKLLNGGYIGDYIGFRVL